MAKPGSLIDEFSTSSNTFLNVFYASLLVLLKLWSYWKFINGFKILLPLTVSLLYNLPHKIGDTREEE